MFTETVEALIYRTPELGYRLQPDQAKLYWGTRVARLREVGTLIETKLETKAEPVWEGFLSLEELAAKIRPFLHRGTAPGLTSSSPGM